HSGVERVRARYAGQSARAGRRDWWHRGRQSERFRQGAEAHRCRDERLLRAWLLLVESRSAPPHPEDRGQDDAAGAERLRTHGVRPASAAAGVNSVSRGDACVALVTDAYVAPTTAAS